MVTCVAQDSGLVRPRQGRWIAGVCAGIADRFEMSRKTVRLLFVVSTILPGPQFIVYIALWVLIPTDE
jgi:phage shock protein PspC (stress-responsive transcriptional regulator)